MSYGRLSVCSPSGSWPIASLRHLTSGRPARRQCLVCVLVTTFFLFPSVSATDDLFSSSFLQSHAGKRGAQTTPPTEDSKEKSNLQLLRVLKSLEQFRGVAILTPIFILQLLGGDYGTCLRVRPYIVHTSASFYRGAQAPSLGRIALSYRYPAPAWDFRTLSLDRSHAGVRFIESRTL
jgi:hypothetical protein